MKAPYAHDAPQPAWFAFGFVVGFILAVAMVAAVLFGGPL